MNAINLDIQSPIGRLLKRYERAKSTKDLWLPHYQELGRYFLTRKQSFQADHEEGAFLDGEIKTHYGQSSALISASAILGNLWPSGAKSLRINPPKALRDKQNVKEFFQKVTEKMTDIMDDPKSNLGAAFAEYMLDIIIFGTSGVMVLDEEENPHSSLPIFYKAWNVKTLCVEEDEKGRIQTVYDLQCMTASQAIHKYGMQAVSSKIREAYATGKEDQRFKILHAIFPIREYDPVSDLVGGRMMKYGSVHVEQESRHLIKSGGFGGFPGAISRFTKAMGEIYGRSPAMTALPSVFELNILREQEAEARELILHPPWMMRNEGALAAGYVDASPDAVNIMNAGVDLRNDPPIVPLYTIGDLRGVKEEIEALKEEISKAFYIDYLLDFNSKQRMTYGEVSIRNKIRGDTLSSVLARQLTEFFTPVVIRTYQILERHGYLGVIRDSIQEAEMLMRGQEIFYVPEELLRFRQTRGNMAFDIEYISPAMRMMEAESLQSLSTGLDLLITAAQVKPEVLDKWDPDKISDKIARAGGNEDITRSQEEVDQIRSGRAEQQKKIEQQEAMTAQATAANAAMQGQAALANSTKE